MSSNELESHITKKYAVRKRLGKGAYGIVWKAVDKKTLEVVALKKIFDAFRNATDAQRTFREIIFLQAFVNHRNIIRLRNVIRAENDKDIYLVFEFMDTDLHNVIKKGSILTEVHKQFIMYQLLAATKYIHSGNVIHRDYKPSNILLDEQCIVKVCDFGLARSLSQITVDDHGDPNLTEYVATRWYRAPEILLACHKYTKGVDMWSLGCILGEMLTEKPLFPGSSTLDQIEKIIASVDPPTKEDISNMQSTYGPSLLEKASRKIRLPLDDLIQTSLSSSSKATPNLFMNAMDLLHHLLQFNQNKRLTAENALNHKYIQRFHNPMEYNNIGHDILNPIPDDVQLTVDEYRTRLYNIVMNIKKEKRIKLAKETVPSIQRNIEENKTHQSVKNTSGQLIAKNDGSGMSKQNDLAFLESTLCKSFSNQISYSTKNNHFTKLQTENNVIRNEKSPKHYCNIMDRQKNHSNNHKTISPHRKDHRIGNSKAEPTVISSHHVPCRIQAPLAWSQHIKPSTINFSQEFNNPIIMRTLVSTNKQCKTSLHGALAKTSSSNHDTTSLNYSQSYGTINASKVVTLNRTKTSN